MVGFVFLAGDFDLAHLAFLLRLLSSLLVPGDMSSVCIISSIRPIDTNEASSIVSLWSGSDGPCALRRASSTLLYRVDMSASGSEMSLRVLGFFGDPPRVVIVFVVGMGAIVVFVGRLGLCVCCLGVCGGYVIVLCVGWGGAGV